MPTNLEIDLEAEKRGLLPPEGQDRLKRARGLGLAPAPISGQPGPNYEALKAQELEKRKQAQQDPKNQSIGLSDIPRAVGAAIDVGGKAALAPEIVAKQAIQSGADALQSRYPESGPATALSKALKFGSEALPTSAGEAAAQVTGERLANPALKAATPIAKKAMGFMAEKLGGLSENTVRILEKRAPDVVKYARMGWEEANTQAASWAKKFQEAISSHVSDASDEYHAAVKTALGDKYGPDFKVNVKQALADTLALAKKEAGYGDTSPLNFADEAPQAKFLKIEQAVNSLENATPEQVYIFQKRLNKSIRDASGSLKGELIQLKGALVDALDSKIPEIQQGNTTIREALNLEKELSKVKNADDAVRVINTATRNKGKTFDAIMKLAGRSREATEALDQTIVASAGKEVSRWSRYLPNNGLLTGAGLAAYKAATLAGSSPIEAAGLSTIGAAATSPRLYGEAFNLGSKLAGKKLPQGLSTAALAALRARRQQEQQP